MASYRERLKRRAELDRADLMRLTGVEDSEAL
jgi:hypothetical protein